MRADVIHEHLTAAGYQIESVRIRRGVIEVAAPAESAERKAAAEALVAQVKTLPARMTLREAELTLLLNPLDDEARGLVSAEARRLKAERLRGRE